MEKKTLSIDNMIAYLRKSRDEGEETVWEVLARHERILQDYCMKSFGQKLPESCIFREVISGETIADRPVMQSVIKMIETKKVASILCVDLQRLSRGDLSDAGELSRLFRYSGCLIVTPQHIYDITDKYDRKFFEMELMRGNEYLEYTKEIMARGRLQSSREGNYIGSIAPYGYERTWIDKAPTLKPSEPEADAVRLIFDWYVNDSIGPVKIAERLDLLGYPPRKSKIWSAATIRGILSNEVYIGKIKWNSRMTQKSYEDGRIKKSRPRSVESKIVVSGLHEPIISEDQFKAALEISASRKNASVKKTLETVNPLCGLLICRCGRTMVLRYNGNLRSSYLLCPNQKNCNSSGVSFGTAFDMICDAIRAVYANLSIVVDQSNTGTVEPLAELSKKELREIERTELKLCDLLERSIYSEELYLLRSAELAKRKEKLLDEIKILDSENRNPLCTNEQYTADIDSIIGLLHEARIPAAQKNKLLKKIIKRIVYSHDKCNRWHSAPIKLELFF